MAMAVKATVERGCWLRRWWSQRVTGAGPLGDRCSALGLAGEGQAVIEWASASGFALRTW